MVSLGQAMAGRREVLSGLTAGEQVVVGDLARVSDGMKVEVLP
jgi:multidrug efflux pump subunit AcrA (membrane-fusion protein)